MEWGNTTEGENGIEVIDAFWLHYRSLPDPSDAKLNFQALAQLVSLVSKTTSGISGFTAADLLGGEGWLCRLRERMSWKEALERCLNLLSPLKINDAGKLLECACAGSALVTQLGSKPLDEDTYRDTFQRRFRAHPPLAVFEWAATWMDALLEDLNESELWVARMGTSLGGGRSVTSAVLETIAGLTDGAYRLHLRQQDEMIADGNDTSLTLRFLFAVIAASEKASAGLPPLPEP
jgi:hypothetical protein